jgi:hypothetical protein
LVIEGEHEAAQLWPEMTVDALRQRRCDGLAIRALPALAAEIDDVPADHQILHNEAGTPFEACTARRGRQCDLAFLIDR